MSLNKRDYLYFIMIGLLIASVAYLPIIIIEKLNQQTVALNTLLNQTQFNAVIDRSIIQDTQIQILGQHGLEVTNNGTHFIFTSKLDNQTQIAIPDIDLIDEPYPVNNKNLKK